MSSSCPGPVSGRPGDHCSSARAGAVRGRNHPETRVAAPRDRPVGLAGGRWSSDEWPASETRPGQLETDGRTVRNPGDRVTAGEGVALRAALLVLSRAPASTRRVDRAVRVTARTQAMISSMPQPRKAPASPRQTIVASAQRGATTSTARRFCVPTAAPSPWTSGVIARSRTTKSASTKTAPSVTHADHTPTATTVPARTGQAVSSHALRRCRSRSTPPPWGAGRAKSEGLRSTVPLTMARPSCVEWPPRRRWERGGSPTHERCIRETSRSTSSSVISEAT